MNTLDTMETGLNVLGIAIGISDVNNWLNLTLLIISVCALIARSVFKCIDLCKQNKYDEASNEMNNLHNDIDKLVNKKEEEKDHEQHQ